MSPADRYLVDGMNVIGSRPDGWWRDLDAAVIRLARCLATWKAAEGAEATVVFDGGPPPGLDEVEFGGLEVAFAGKAARPTTRSCGGWGSTRTRARSGW